MSAAKKSKKSKRSEKPEKSKASGAPKKPPPPDDDGFTIEDDGMVDIRLELHFDEDVKIRVTPEVAKRIMDGEFDHQDPADIPGLDIVEIFDTTRIIVESAYEGRPPKPPADIDIDDGGDDLPFISD